MDSPWANAARQCLVILVCFASAFPVAAQQKGPASTPKPKEAWIDEPMVDLAKACPTIAIELRYATSRNLTGNRIYPENARCLVRESVAQRLIRAQNELHAKGFGLKIWDAYRPIWAQKLLWQAKPNPDFLQSPSHAASMHSRGVAVDATLVDLEGHPLPMPTDFDDFSPAAQLRYSGGDSAVAKNLRTLQIAMGNAGFFGMSNEWWHFVAKDFAKSRPVDMDIRPENQETVKR